MAAKFFARALLLLCVAAPQVFADDAAVLSNDRVRAEFGARGLTALAGAAPAYRISSDEFVITIDGRTYDSGSLPSPAREIAKDRIVYTWTAGTFTIRCEYGLGPDQPFVAKRLSIPSGPKGKFHVDAITVFRTRLAEAADEVYVPKNAWPSLGTGDYGACLRFDGSRGLLAVVENPFLKFDRNGSSFSLRYQPDMDWSFDYGPYAADAGLLAPYTLTGRRLPAKMLPEWKTGTTGGTDGMDRAEIDAFTECVRASMIYRPEHPIDIVVGWCSNDYQIDVATPEGRAEYKRIFDRAAELGARYVLYAPTNSALSRRVESLDDWSWENLLWLGLGQKIRKKEWDPASSPIPPSVQEMLDYARSKNLELLAYVYPVVPFSQNENWLVSPPNRHGRRYANLGFRSFQDWLIEELTTFQRRLGIGGYSFDHTFLTYNGRSRYAQWRGWRRVMEELRRRVPGIVIDGRQAYQYYGPWSWLAGSYPHPTSQDEQPESFVPFPDLHFDRVSADRERWTAYRYRNYEFAPSELVPGYMTHQTSRSDDTGDMPHEKTDRDVLLTRFRARDWDYLGWRYSVLSSIAAGGWNNVIDMIPARDPEEYRSFSEADKQWFRHWLGWTDENKEYLRHTRTILGQPAVGKIDGTAAVKDGRGFVFLFNPNGRRLAADVALDDTIGLDRRGKYLLEELYPLEGRRIGKPDAGFWNYGDTVSIPMDGGSAMVLALAPAQVREPMLFNAPGSVSLSGGSLDLNGVMGEKGTEENLIVRLPEGASLEKVRISGREVPFSRPAGNVAAMRVRFAGEPFGHYQQIGSYDPKFAGGDFESSFAVPGRIFDQLAARQKAWPIPWDPEDYRTTWLSPQRLLLFVQIVEPDPEWNVRMEIDGREVELRRAYSAVRAEPSTFVGFYADVSLLSPDTRHDVKVSLPALKPGQFQGLFFENVETEYTGVIAR